MVAKNSMRKETEKALNEAKTSTQRLFILLYIEHGWDHYWSYPNMPMWLKPRYGYLFREDND